MASAESMAIRSNEALDRIEKTASELLGADVPKLQRLHRDRDMLRVIQLETIAQWLEEIQENQAQSNSKDVEAMFAKTMVNAPKNAQPRRK